MKSLTLVVVLITFSNTLALSCPATSDGKPKEIPLSIHNSTDVIQMIEDLPTVDYGASGICRVKLSIDYNERRLFIAFTEHLVNNTLDNHRIQVDIHTREVKTGEISIAHYLEYACSEHRCDREFVKKYINWFINAAKLELIKQLEPYILSAEDDDRGHCVGRDFKVNECSTAQCVADLYTGNDGNLKAFPFCAEKSDLDAAGLWFTLKFSTDFQYNYRWYRFQCNHDNCNDVPVLNKVLKIFNEHYSILPILEAFGFKNNGEAGAGTTTASTKSLTSPPRSSTSTSSVASASSTRSVKSSAALTPLTNSSSSTTVPDTTTKSNHALHIQSFSTLIHIALIIVLFRLFSPP